MPSLIARSTATRMTVATPRSARSLCSIFLLLAYTCAAGLMGCGPSDPVVAEIAEKTITADQLRTFVEKLPGGLKSPYEGDAARRHYLQSLVDRQLMLLEGHRRGLDTTRAVTGAVDNTTRSWLTTLYLSSVVAPRVQVDTEDIQRLITERGYDRERKLNAILVHTREEIDTVATGLAEGVTFAEMARRFSLDDRSAAQGGELGFVDVEAAERSYVPADVFRDLPLGQVSEPLSAGKSWHVVRFTEDRPADPTKARHQLKEELYTQGLQQAQEEEQEQLRARFSLVRHDEALSLIVDAYRRQNTTSLDNSDMPLYTFDGEQVSVRAAQQVLRGGAPPRVLAQREGAIAILNRRVLAPRMFAHAAIVEDLVDGAELEEHRRELREDILLATLRRQETDMVDVSEIEVRQFYDDHPEQFVHERSVWAEELLLATESEARQVHQLIVDGADLAELVSRSLRADAERRSARHHYHPGEVALYPRLVPAMLAAKKGELMGPLEVDGGWSVFRIAYANEGGIEPFDSVQRQARALLLKRRQQSALGAFLQHLRDTHASVVVIHAEHLAKALPDEVL